MAKVRLLANMNISPETVNVLHEKGLDIIRVSQMLPATSSDAEILDLARRENRVLVTQDLDFSALLALGGFNSPSLITMRMTVSDPEAVTQRLLELLPPTVNHVIKGIKMRGAGGRTSSWAKSPYFSVFPASPSPNKLIGSRNPGHDGGLVGRRILPALGRR